tara:strand:- start:386 stop:1558 length:1173 start_codon:yes stop_codon:yes gene_type:complete
MSEIKVNSIKGVGATTAAITVNNTDGTCTANITNKSNRNLIINGAMQVAQRGTSSTSNGYGSVDRFKMSLSNVDENPTQAQADVASGTTPYSLGFRKSFKVTNGNQTSGAQVTDVLIFTYILEAQDIASSGWNYTDSNSFITLSFWVKSSVAQNFFMRLLTIAGTSQQFPMETGSLSADTWTKVTKTIPGNSNLTFNSDNGLGLKIEFVLYRGTNFTGSTTLNQWAANNASVRHPDCTTTWYTTNDATFEVTGLQLEVGSVATDFEFKSFAEVLLSCQRYYQRYQHGTFRGINFVGRKSGSNTVVGSAYGFLPMRTAATGSIDSTSGFKLFRFTDTSTHTPSSITFTHEDFAPFNVLKFTAAVTSYASTGHMIGMFCSSAGGTLELDAEL